MQLGFARVSMLLLPVSLVIHTTSAGLGVPPHHLTSCCLLNSNSPLPLLLALHFYLLLLTVSKDTRVRAEGFVKIIAMLMSLNGLNVASRSFSRCFASAARASMSMMSSLLKSSRCRKCLPASGGDTALPLYVVAVGVSTAAAARAGRGGRRLLGLTSTAERLWVLWVAAEPALQLLERAILGVGWQEVR